MYSSYNSIKLSKNENIDFYKKTAVLVFPMALQNLINVGITASDTLMLGTVGERAISAVSLANQIQFILILILFGTASGAGILAAQYWGKGSIAAIEKIIALSVNIAIFTGLIFSLGVLIIPEKLMHLYSSDIAVIKLGSKYLRIVGWTYIISSITTIYLSIIKSAEKVIISTVVYGCSLIINIIINATLVFGLFGFPKLGVIGVAIGTVIARIFEFIVTMLYSNRKNCNLKIQLKYMMHIDKWLITDFKAYALPVVINELMWGLGTSINSAIVGQLNTSAAAANAIAIVSRQLTQIIVMGVAGATAIILGKLIGENKKDLAKLYSQKFIRLVLLLSLVSACVIQFIKPIPAKIMHLSPEALAYLTFMLNVITVYLILQSFNTTMIIGVFRAGGDSRYGLYADIGTLWCFSIPTGFICAFILNLDVKIVYLFLMSDELLKVPLDIWRYRTNIWLKNITR